MENNKKQTAVDWYFEKIKSHFEHDGDLLETLTFTMAIAKQKEKEQIVDAFGIGAHYKSTSLIGYHSMADEYYNETFKGGSYE